MDNNNHSEQQPQEEQTTSRVFNPREHLMQIRSGQTSQDYLPVKWRIAWFRSAFPRGVIETEMLHLDMDRDTEEEGYAWNAERRRSEKVIKQAKGFCVFRAVVRDGEGGVATGTKSEKAASFGDFIEKAESGAIGRALAALGYGTQFCGDEWEEAHRIVDSPVERQSAAAAAATTERPAGSSQLTSVRPASNGGSRQPQGNDSETPTDATAQQLSSIRKLRDHLGKSTPADETLSYDGARKLIQQLTGEYRQSKQNNRAS